MGPRRKRNVNIKITTDDDACVRMYIVRCDRVYISYLVASDWAPAASRLIGLLLLLLTRSPSWSQVSSGSSGSALSGSHHNFFCELLPTVGGDDIIP